MRTGIPLLILCGVLTSALLTGCAGSAPKANYVRAPKADVKVDANDTFSVQVKAASGVDMLALEKQRLEQLIEQKINAVKGQNTAGGVCARNVSGPWSNQSGRTGCTSRSRKRGKT